MFPTYFINSGEHPYKQVSDLNWLLMTCLPEANFSVSACLNKEDGNPIWLRVSFPLACDVLRVMENETPLNAIISTTSIDISVRNKIETNAIISHPKIFVFSFSFHKKMPKGNY